MLLRVLRFYQKFFRLLVIPSLLLALCAAWQVSLRPLFTLEAFLEVPDISLQEWRQTQPYLWDETWVARSFASDDEDLRKLQTMAQSPAFWSSTANYRPSIFREDFREIPGLQNEKNSGLGVTLKLQVRDAEQAQHHLQALTEHIRQAFLANDLLSAIREGQKALAERAKLQTEQLQVSFEIQQAEQRIRDMRDVMERYPESRQMSPNTVVSVRDEGGKYLAPLPQIVALEATISESKARLRKLERDLHKLDATALLMADMNQVLQQAASGTEILARLQQNRTRLESLQPELMTAQNEALQEFSAKTDLAKARYDAMGAKSHSALSLAPIPARNPVLVGTAVFFVVLGGLSLWLALHGWLHGSEPALRWLPRRVRALLIGGTSV
ncbi:hypothetical protein A9179_07590 [Pseudomonas alcaligenes]|uniref:Lipopolysaccharide biosynthesis protein n=1 Tax=Aquipseudomonas alcaligenes TaxID=43263 RepID=A0ABR7RY61_AQUAC|nr:hypothetical protein [Pseudomonas alcaligenes]